MINVDAIRDIVLVGNMSAHHNRRTRLVFPDHFAHFLHFADICNNRADADDIVGIFPDFGVKAIEGGKVQKSARGIDIGLNHHQSEGAVKHAEGKTALNSGDLILIEFHGVDFSASIFIVLGVRSEDAG
jgi:hypothetical protein